MSYQSDMCCSGHRQVGSQGKKIGNHYSKKWTPTSQAWNFKKTANITKSSMCKAPKEKQQNKIEHLWATSWHLF